VNYYRLLYHIRMRKRSVVGENIRRLRIAAGITQEELALRSELSQGYINQLEMEKRKYTQKSLELIADALSADIIEFFKTEENDENENVTPHVTGKPTVNRNRQAVSKELLSVIRRLPMPIAEHYLSLMKIESDMLRPQKRIL